MANLDFFAVRDDFITVFDRLFASTDIQILETYSQYSQQPRRFRSTRELIDTLPIGLDKYGNSYAFGLSLWSPTVMPEPEIRRIDFRKEIEGHTHRFYVEGRGLMHLHLGGIFKTTITKSNFSHLSEKGAAAWGPVIEINWPMSRKLSNKIQYLLRRKLAVGRARTMPVLEAALEAHKQGYKFVDGVWPCELSQEAASAVQETSLVRYNQSCS